MTVEQSQRSSYCIEKSTKESYLYPTKFSAVSSKEPRYLNSIYFKQHESHIMYALFVRVEQILIHYFHDSFEYRVTPQLSAAKEK